MATGPILIADDEPQNLAALNQILSNQYRLVFARNGAETIHAAARHSPSLILLDIQMPDMDGYEVCRRLKSNPVTADIPVIFVTSLAEAGNEAAGFEVGAVDYIVKPVSPAVVSARVRTHLSLVRAARLEQSYRDAIYMLGAAGHHNDNDTGMHIWRMADYAKALAGACGWDGEACNLIALAAPMHDTGKIGIPDSVLKKRGKLDEGEWAIMKMHPRYGHEILSKSEAPVFRMAAEIALCHHERWDGTGYPDGRAGQRIPESARIVAVADVYDALSMKRPYKEAWPTERVLDTLRKYAGSHFEPRVLDAFLSILPQILEIQAMWNAREAQAEGAATQNRDESASSRTSGPSPT